jgi:hypothetical protein
LKGSSPPVLPEWPAVNDLLTLPQAERLELPALIQKLDR